MDWVKRMKKVFSFCLAILLVLVAITACKKSGASDEYVLIMDGEKISKTEYMIYLYEQKKSFEEKGGEDIWEVDFDGMTAEEVAKQNAVNSILMVKAAVKHSESMDVSVAEDEASLRAEAEELLAEVIKSGMLSQSVKIDDIYNIIVESHIQQAVYESITAGFESSESDFEAYLDEYYNTYKKQYNIVIVDDIFVMAGDGTNRDKIDLANQELSSGADFDAVKAKYSENADKQPFEIESGMFSAEVENALYEMSVGQISPIMEDNQGYYIFKVLSVKTTDKESIRDSVEANYIREKKQEIYQKQNETWEADISVEKNKEVWDSIHIL